MAEKRTIPQVRFAGFADNWKTHRLEEVAEEIIRNDPNSTAPVMMITAENGFIRQSERYSFDNSGQSLKKYILLKKNELAYNHGASKLRPYGSCFALIEEKARIPFVYHCFAVGNNNSQFVSIELNSSKVEVQLRKLVTSGARMDGLLNISYEDYCGVLIDLPDIEEQDKISNYFLHLNDLIAEEQAKFEKLQNLKKSMLRKMFPKDGSDVPEIRFARFNKAWEKRKVGELTRVASAARVHKEEWTSSGVPFFRSSDVVSAYKGTDNEKAYISYELYNELSKASGKLEKNDILVTGGGSIGIPYIVPDNKPLYSKDADLIWIKNSESFNSQYLYMFFSTPCFRAYISSISHIGTIAHYTIEQVKDTPVYLPEIDEQTLVGNYFHALDNLITLHQRELEKLKNLKKALLERMFI
jgi:type I restriction enzyme S subunit